MWNYFEREGKEDHNSERSKLNRPYWMSLWSTSCESVIYNEILDLYRLVFSSPFCTSSITTRCMEILLILCKLLFISLPISTVSLERLDYVSLIFIFITSQKKNKELESFYNNWLKTLATDEDNKEDTEQSGSEL